MTDNGMITFTFFNIQLPDSGSNFTASNGYVSFSIKTKSALAESTIINNVAGIVFDFNPAIITNITADTIRGNISTSIEAYGNNTAWMVYPNPSSTNIVFKSITNSISDASLKIMNLEGQVVFEKQNIVSMENIDISNLADGIYICTIQSNKGIETIKLIKHN